jgi:PBSX family phage terminase large subunit
MTEIEWDEEVHLRAYDKIRESDAAVKLYWGGRDSGKSYEIALSLVKKCLTASYFKCILVREHFNSIKESQWELFQKVVQDFDLEDQFDFKLSPLEIVCVNGNRFIARGCDNPSSIKSVNEPTDAWFEEADKIKRSQYQTIATTLRSSEVQVVQWISFNPESEGSYEDHWLFELVQDQYGGTWEWSQYYIVDGKEVEVKYCSCHTTFDDNRFCPPERKANYMATTEGDDYYYNVYIYGYWGNRKAQNPFLTAYDDKRHVGDTKFDPRRQSIVLIDFNVVPFTANIYQNWFDDEGSHYHQVAEISIPNGTIEEMSERIKGILGDSVYTAQFGGDYNGSQAKIGRYDNKSLYKELRKALNIAWAQFKLKANPPHKTSRVDCNYFLTHFPDFLIDSACRETRRDCRSVQVDAYGSIIKKNRKDESQRADNIDNFRYLINTFLKGAIEKHKKTGTWF